MEEIQIFRFAVLQVKRNRKESCIFIPYCLETCVCCYKAGDTASMLSKSDAVAVTQLTAMLYVLLFTCLPICDTCFGQIFFTRGPSYVTAWLGRISVFPNTVWACGVRSRVTHQLCAVFPLCNSLSPSLIQDHSSRLEWSPGGVMVQPPAWAGPTSMLLRTRPGDLWVSPRMEISQPLWAPAPCLTILTMKSVFLSFSSI